MDLPILLHSLGLLAGHVTALLLVRAVRLHSSRGRLLCPRCRFDLRGMAAGGGVCPECGHQVTDPARLRPPAWAWRWRLALAPLCVGVGAWATLHAQGPRQFRLCAWLATHGDATVLAWIMPTQPRLAASEMVRRIELATPGPAEVRVYLQAALADLDRNAGSKAPSPGASVMRALRGGGSIPADALGDLLAQCLPPPAAAPAGRFTCDTSGAVTLVAGLRPTSRASWIRPQDVRIQIESARLGKPDGSWLEMERRSPQESDTGTLFHGAVFVGPSEPGVWTGEMTVRLRQGQAGANPFERVEQVPFALQVAPRQTPPRDP